MSSRSCLLSKLAKIIFSHVAVAVNDYCIAESFKASWLKSEVVMMQHAFYGRMKLGRCITTDLGYLGCKAGNKKFNPKSQLSK